MIETSKGKLPVYFGMNTLALFGTEANKSMSDVLVCAADLFSLPPADLLTLFYCGFVIGAKKEGVECKLESVDELGFMMDDDPELVTNLMALYMNQSSPEKVEQTESKKK